MPCLPNYGLSEEVFSSITARELRLPGAEVVRRAELPSDAGNWRIELEA
jgi:hypothetical protein